MQSREAPEPRYDHLAEVLDGAASLRMAVRQARAALREERLAPQEREALESVLAASQERLDRIRSLLRAPSKDAVEFSASDEEPARKWTERELIDAGRAAEGGSEEAERDAARALDRLGRGLRIESRGSVESFLSHPSPRLRAVSIKVLGMHWRLREYTDRLLWSLASDDEADCRRAAALSLGRLYAGTQDRRVGADLAAALRRSDEEPDVRWASYYALLDLEGRPPAGRPLPLDEFDPASDPDPELMKRYAGQ